MNEQRSAFTAVQEDATSFCMDWPVFEPAGQRAGRSAGTVFVLDGAGVRISDCPLTATNNRAADEALNLIGWTRSGAWHSDAFGRRAATVIAVGSLPGATRPNTAGSGRDRIAGRRGLPAPGVRQQKQKGWTAVGHPPLLQLRRTYFSRS